MSKSKKGNPVCTLFDDEELKTLDILVGFDKSSRAAVVRKSVNTLYILTTQKPELTKNFLGKII
jgi:hypothetical protein